MSEDSKKDMFSRRDPGGRVSSLAAALGCLSVA